MVLTRLSPLSRRAILCRASLTSERLICRSGFAADTREAFLRGVVLFADVDRLGVGAGGLFLVAEPLVGKATAVPGIEIARIDRHGVVEIVGGGLRVAQREAREPARDVRLGLLLNQAQRCREIVHREL